MVLATEAETLISTNLEQEENEPKTLAEDTTANTEFAVAQTDAGVQKIIRPRARMN